MELKHKRNNSAVLSRLIPKPRSMGAFLILIVILAFTSSWLRKELALALLGSVFLVVLAYCFFGILFLGIACRRKIGSLKAAIASETIPVGVEGELFVDAGFKKLPAILIRFELCLKTKDSRVIRHYADPCFEKRSVFPVRQRGAFQTLKTGGYARVIIFDAPGFFRLELPVNQDENYRLLALPSPSSEAVSLSLKSGGTREREKPHYRKSEDFTDQRPYVPGDDPRRINWKLYSHAPGGDLFVREGDNEPPPHSRLLILIDTEADSSIYDTLEESCAAVDKLCEDALAAALDFAARGMEILIGYTGGKIFECGSSAARIACALAWPAAIPWPAVSPLPVQEELPHPGGDLAVLVFALRRKTGEPSALDRFLKARFANTEVVFLK